MTPRPTPSEQRMAELCAIRRPLTEDEVSEVLALAKRIRDNNTRRERCGHTPRSWPSDRREYFAARYQAQKARQRGQQA